MPGFAPDVGSAGDPLRAAADLAIHTRALTKSFRHPWTLRVTRSLQALDLDVRRGEVFGYLGPNGAGKTTTIKLLTGLLQPTSGAGWLLGAPLGSAAARRHLGFLPEQPYFFDTLSGLETLEYLGQLAGLHGHESTERAREWLGRVGLGERERLAVRKYSKGMLQRLGLAAALLHEPELLVLDEPMTGLDPFGRRDVRELILEQRARGVTVLFSSHILPDAEMLCDRVGVVLGGRLVRTGTVNELVASRQQRVEIRCIGAPLVEMPARFRGTLSRTEHPEGTTFVVERESDLTAVLGWLLDTGITIRAVTPQRATLEEFFMAVADAARPGPPERRSA